MVMLLSQIVTTNHAGRKTAMLPTPQKPRRTKLAIFVATMIITAALLAGVSGYYMAHTAAASNSPTPSTPSTQADSNALTDNASLPKIYQDAAPSVVVVQDDQLETSIFNQEIYEQVQGSGFTYSVNGEDVIITNYHVVENDINVTVTFQDGNSYTVKVLGSDPYSDLAVLSTDAPQNELIPLTIVSSSTLQVGDQAIAIGSPYGLTG